MSNTKAIQTFVRERPTNGRDGIVDPPSLVLDEVAKTATAFSGKGVISEIKYDSISLVYLSGDRDTDCG